jgi:hypothetical protein
MGIRAVRLHRSSQALKNLSSGENDSSIKMMIFEIRINGNYKG